MTTSRFARDFETALALVQQSASPIMPSDIERIFAQWWAHEGQFECASGQDDHRSVIFSAFLAGWDACNRAKPV